MRVLFTKFGGQNIVWSGDYSQLTPVAMTPIYMGDEVPCFHHFMNSFIECGFDIINPVQCSAAHMEPERLKAKYGPHLVFWGGGVDTQKTLPFGKPEQVREEVLRRCETLGSDGGYVFNSIHNVQARTPVGNIVAMIEAVHEFNG